MAERTKVRFGGAPIERRDNNEFRLPAFLAGILFAGGEDFRYIAPNGKCWFESRRAEASRFPAISYRRAVVKSTVTSLTLGTEVRIPPGAATRP